MNIVIRLKKTDKRFGIYEIVLKSVIHWYKKRRVYCFVVNTDDTIKGIVIRYIPTSSVKYIKEHQE